MQKNSMAAGMPQRGFHHHNSLEPTVSIATKHGMYQPTAHKPFQAIGRQQLLLFQEKKGKQRPQHGISRLLARQELETPLSLPKECTILRGIITGIADFSTTYTSSRYALLVAAVSGNKEPHF